MCSRATTPYNLYYSMHIQKDPYAPMGEIHWTWSLIWEHCAQLILMTIDFPNGHIASPIIWDWGPHGGKCPHLQILGPPWGTQWGPFSPMGTNIFSYPILKGKYPTQKIVDFCVGHCGPLLCSHNVLHLLRQGVHSYAGWKQNPAPMGTLDK